MKMTIGAFLAVAIDAHGGELRPLISMALAHYRKALDAAERPIGVPAFLDAPDRHRTEVDIPIEPALEELLRAEAARQQVRVESVLSHAVFLYLADLDRTAEASTTR
jgi:hypothetical protein